MSIRVLITLILSALFILSGCGGNSFDGRDLVSTNPTTPEPAYYGTPTDIPDSAAVRVTMSAKFLYRALDFTPGGSSNGLSSVVSQSQALGIPYAEFHIYDSAGNRIQQGETTSVGLVHFELPKTAGSYTIKVFSRAFNSYAKVSVLEDIYANTPYSISTTFTITNTDINTGTKDLSGTPMFAEADENLAAKLEGGAFNIMYNIVMANDYIRRNIQKNGESGSTGIPSSDPNKWWVADKVSIFWKAGFNPYTYFGGSAALSFYSPGNSKLYILGGTNGDVRASDTDHFDDSIILHEYAHFLEDTYGHSQSPGGSHTGNFIIDPRLAWSEGWANFFQAAVLTGADAYENSAPESRMPPSNKKRYQYYIDTYGYKGSKSYGINIAFNLAEIGTSASYDNVSTHPQDTGIFREVSIARTLYKGTRGTSEKYPDNLSTKFGGGILFGDIWKVFAGEDTAGHSKAYPLNYSFNNKSHYPLPNGGLFNWLLKKNNVSSSKWEDILAEERQTIGTQHYAYLLESGACNSTGAFENATFEKSMMASDPIDRSDQQMNNDFYLYYHDGSGSSLSMSYSTTGTAMDLDLILYKKDYVYFEDAYWVRGRSSDSIVKQSRTAGVASEQISLSGLSTGYYLINIKVNMNQSYSTITGTATYTIKKDASTLCGTERP